jgi:hypothetical protein
MGKSFESIDDRVAAFIRTQHVFFVATAPLAADGHVNLSPKGLGSFAILGPGRVAYLDLVGSGAETIAHARENGRIVFMFCAFEGPPRIVRLHGRARAVEPGDSDFEEFAASFDPAPNTRAIIVADIERVADSCGYGVPLLRFEAERDQLTRWAERKGQGAVAAYQLENNLESLDGLPALRAEKLRTQ